ncbi:hypothetical protein ACP0HM_13510 [Escherichia coli]
MPEGKNHAGCYVVQADRASLRGTIVEAPAGILMTGCGICVPIASIMTSRITIGEVVNQPRSLPVNGLRRFRH